MAIWFRKLHCIIPIAITWDHLYIAALSTPAIVDSKIKAIWLFHIQVFNIVLASGFYFFQKNVFKIWSGKLLFLYLHTWIAQVAKLVDALCSGRSVRKDVLVRIQSWALRKTPFIWTVFFVMLNWTYVVDSLAVKNGACCYRRIKLLLCIQW